MFQILLLISILFVLKGCSLNVVNRLLQSDVWCVLIVFTWPPLDTGPARKPRGREEHAHYFIQTMTAARDSRLSSLDK